jgi:tetratricopeptide (TPR) repeat protein
MVEAEILAIKSCQRLAQGEHEEAFGLVDRALPVFRRSDNFLLLGDFLIHRAILLLTRQEPEEAISTLLEVYGLLEDHTETSKLLLATLGTLARLLAHLGRRREATATLHQAEALCAAIGDPLQRYQLTWAEGVLQVCMDESAAAEQLFGSVREGFTALRSEEYLATATLDLALLYQRQGRHQEILPLVNAALPILDRFPYQKRALDSLGSLHREVQRGAISPLLLQEIHLLSLSNTL